MTYQFKIQLKGITKPPVWRRVLVPDTYTFKQFHLTIQEAFGWFNIHLYSFSDKAYRGSFRISEPDEMDDWYTIPTHDAGKVKLASFWEGDSSRTLFYWCDFGDDWIHTIKLEAVSEEVILKPRCLAGKGACPPEDCGGVYGYEDLKYVFREMPKSGEAKELREWLGLRKGEIWNADYFDIETTNNRLSQL